MPVAQPVCRTTGLHTLVINDSFSVPQDMLKSLSEEMDESLIPQAYGGQNTVPLYESKQELELRELVKRLNSSAAGGAQAQESAAKLKGMQTNGN